MDNNVDKNIEEKVFFDNYNINDYERPSVATDIAIFSILNDGENHNFRKPQTKTLKILLIKRASYPFKDCWALPGGFCKPNEDVYETARRELQEETNVGDAYLHLIDVYSDIGRDPRGWIMSQTFMALMDGEKCKLRAGTDAWEAEWFNVKLTKNELKREYSNDIVDIETEYSLELNLAPKNIYLSAKIIEYKQYKDYHQDVRYEIIESDKIAFDHAKLIANAILSLRRMANREQEIIFDLMPEQFTLTQLQNVFESILDKELLTPNFRRKIADYVIETDEMSGGAGFRPAKLFRRNINIFYGE